MHCVDAGRGHPVEDELHACLECPAFAEVRVAIADRNQDGMPVMLCVAKIKWLWHSFCTGCMLELD